MPRKKREKQVEKDCKHNWMNTPGVKNPRKKQGTEKEKWENGSKETLLKVIEVKARFCKLQVN